jgi:3-isopropylmalate/(R)-2-methylmalate dehydratase small subunit
MNSGLATTGRCWKLPDNVSSDALIAAEHVFEYDPRMLRKHLLHELRPELARTAAPGDLLLAGRRFAHGSQHSHPFIAMKALGLGLLAIKLTRAPFRISVYMGVPLLEIGQDVYDSLDDGETIAVDFATGVIRRVDKAIEYRVEPLQPFVIEIVSAGGGLLFLKQQIKDGRDLTSHAEKTRSLG